MYIKPDDGGYGKEINITNDLHLDMLHVIAKNIEELTDAVRSVASAIEKAAKKPDTKEMK